LRFAALAATCVPQSSAPFRNVRFAAPETGGHFRQAGAALLQSAALSARACP
jgi:hypothetical protein